MAVTDAKVTLDEGGLRRIQALLRELNLDAWLLYDFHGLNPVASGVLGLPALTRRYAVLLPAENAPIALTHRIEQQPWREWTGVNRPYLGWQSFEGELRALLEGRSRVALEYSQGDAVPYLDRVPAGVLDLVRAAGVEAVSSGDLVSAFYSRWSQAGEESHDRAARILQETADAAFDRIGSAIGAGETLGEWSLREWIRRRLAEQGLAVGVDAVVAVGANAANPHYAPSEREQATIRRGDLILIDLWGKERDEAVFADQTWMGYVGDRVPDRYAELFAVIRDAREAAVELIRARVAAGAAVAGFEVDDAARQVVEEHGYGDAFIHRTGHSIDRELHGSGPNIDNLETRDERRLIPGVGFSIEPGIYLPGDVGLRTEIDVLMTVDGPRITTPQRQMEIKTVYS